MIEPRRELYLTQKTIGPQRSGQIGVQDLERYDAIVLRILCEYTVAIPPRPSSRSIV
jgi:hypothetical protein